MKIFFDTEFTGLYKDNSLISIGLVTEDERTFYAELSNYDRTQCDNWVQDNVINNLHIHKLDKYLSNYHYGDKDSVRFSLKNWLIQFEGEGIELVSDCCHYDMVLFVDLFGNAFNIPKNVCPACYDINQDIARYYKISLMEAFNKSREEILLENGINISGDKHNALYDAKVIRAIYKIVNNIGFGNFINLKE